MSEQIDTFAKALAEAPSARLSQDEAMWAGLIASHLSMILLGQNYEGVRWDIIRSVASIAYERTKGGNS